MESKTAEIPYLGQLSSRLETYTEWPFKNTKCTPLKMSEAGFYLCNPKEEPDLAKCFFCLKELDGWEPDDDPWKEHEKHAPYCPFVKLGKEWSKITCYDMMNLIHERSCIIIKKQKEASQKLLQEAYDKAKEEFLKEFL